MKKLSIVLALGTYLEGCFIQDFFQKSRLIQVHIHRNICIDGKKDVPPHSDVLKKCVFIMESEIFHSLFILMPLSGVFYKPPMVVLNLNYNMMLQLGERCQP